MCIYYWCVYSKLCLCKCPLSCYMRDREHIFCVWMPVCGSSRLLRRIEFRKELLLFEGRVVTIVFTFSMLRSHQPLHMAVVGMLWSSQLSDFSCSWRNKNLGSFMRICLNVIFAHLWDGAVFWNMQEGETFESCKFIRIMFGYLTFLHMRYNSIWNMQVFRALFSHAPK